MRSFLKRKAPPLWPPKQLNIRLRAFKLAQGFFGRKAFSPKPNQRNTVVPIASYR